MNLVVGRTINTNTQIKIWNKYLSAAWRFLLSVDECSVPTSSGNHGKPRKAPKSSMHGKIMEFVKTTLNNHG